MAGAIDGLNSHIAVQVEKKEIKCDEGEREIDECLVLFILIAATCTVSQISLAG